MPAGRVTGTRPLPAGGTVPARRWPAAVAFRRVVLCLLAVALTSMRPVWTATRRGVLADGLGGRWECRADGERAVADGCDTGTCVVVSDIPVTGLRGRI